MCQLPAEGAQNAPIRLGMRRMGLAAPAAVGTDASRRDALISLFESTGFQNIESRMINIAVAFRDFDNFWQSQTPTYNNIGKVIERLPDADRRKLKEAAPGLRDVCSGWQRHLSRTRKCNQGACAGMMPCPDKSDCG